jgi:hypothetical protein
LLIFGAKFTTINQKKINHVKTIFFILCSGMIMKSWRLLEGEQTKYAGIGAVFFTAVMAFIASAYALFTVLTAYIPPCFWISLEFAHLQSGPSLFLPFEKDKFGMNFYRQHRIILLSSLS